MSVTVVTVDIGELSLAPWAGFCLYPVSNEETSNYPIRGPSLLGRAASAMGLVHPHHTWTWAKVDSFPWGVECPRKRYMTLPEGWGLYRVRERALIHEILHFEEEPFFECPIHQKPPSWWSQLEQFDGEIFTVNRRKRLPC